jgi:hypothetical protein
VRSLYLSGIYSSLYLNVPAADGLIDGKDGDDDSVSRVTISCDFMAP